MFLCGVFDPHCGACTYVDDFLCFFPVDEGKTCEMLLCEGHASDDAPNVYSGNWCRYLRNTQSPSVA